MSQRNCRPSSGATSSKDEALAPTAARPWSRAARRALLALALGGLGPAAHGDSQSVIEFGYDAAGNLIRIETQVQSAPPSIDTLDPSFINRGITKSFTATGSNLLGVEIAPSDPKLVPSGVVASATQVTFLLTAPLDTTLGTATLTFTTLLGQAQANIEVGARLPKLTSVPAPIVLPGGSPPTPFEIRFDAPLVGDRTFDVSTGDPGIATVTPSSVLLPGGETKFTVNLSGVALGATSLEMFNAEFVAPLVLPVAVSASFTGDGESHATVGVFVQSADGTGPLYPRAALDRVGVHVGGDGSLPGARVGVRVGGADLHTSRVGVNVGGAGHGSASYPVGILVGSNSGATISQPPQTGVVVGPLLFASAPAGAAAGISTDLILTGVNLDAVDAVTLSPSADIVVGVLSVNPEGTQLTVPLSVDVGAATGPRTIIAEAAGTPVEALDDVVLEISVE